MFNSTDQCNGLAQCDSESLSGTSRKYITWQTFQMNKHTYSNPVSCWKMSPTGGVGVWIGGHLTSSCISQLISYQHSPNNSLKVETM